MQYDAAVLMKWWSLKGKLVGAGSPSMEPEKCRCIVFEKRTCNKVMMKVIYKV
jgi:hypothetical protein